jgi:hypothetical protein
VSVIEKSFFASTVGFKKYSKASKTVRASKKMPA